MESGRPGKTPGAPRSLDLAPGDTVLDTSLAGRTDDDAPIQQQAEAAGSAAQARQTEQ